MRNTKTALTTFDGHAIMLDGKIDQISDSESAMVSALRVMRALYESCGRPYHDYRIAKVTCIVEVVE